MKYTALIFLVLAMSSHLSAQNESASMKPFSIGNIEFTITPKQIDNDFKVQFLFPRSQELEMYLTDLTGDLVRPLLEKQIVSHGVHNLSFEFGDKLIYGSYLLIIKSAGKSIIKKMEYQPKI